MLLSLLDKQTLSEPAWYCVRTQPKHEHIVGAWLARNLRLETFHPRLKSERPTRRGPVRIIEPLFPCYIFARFVLEAHLDEVRHVNGVSNLVHFGHGIPIIPDPVIDELKLCFEAEETMAVEEPLRPGVKVTVAEGSFIGFRGIMVRLLPSRQRVQILLDFLGRTTVAEVDRTALILESPCFAELVPSLALV
jgi:transcriptional antiterminator RfaH